MRPTVLSLAYPFAALTADPVGGAEQVLAHLDRALVRAGSRSVVIGAEGSTPAGELVAVPAVPGEIKDAARSRTHAAVRAAVSAVIARERVDLVHLHGIDFDAYLPPPGPPILVSLHLPISWYAPGALHPQRPNTHLLPFPCTRRVRRRRSCNCCRRSPRACRRTIPGGPVAATRSGALPEAVEHGRTGFIVDDAAGMADAMRRVDEIDPENCRAAARERFSLQRMTDQHLELYERLIRGAAAPSARA
ncbi:MAG: glycosyltransferase [Proteobacteria bacterium]|nr:glycosyltransferase [Pseudomonadota bacterium]